MNCSEKDLTTTMKSSLKQTHILKTLATFVKLEKSDTKCEGLKGDYAKN